MARLVLVHGGVHGAWCWDRVIGPLRERGHDVVTVDLPGRGTDPQDAATVTLDDWVDAVSAAAGEGAVLVAHSMGGLSCSQLAERRPEAVERIVYVAAVVPGDGEAGLPVLQLRGGGSRLLEPGGIVPGGDGATATVPPDAAAEAFYSGTAPLDVDWAIPQLCPEPLAPLMTPLSLGTAFGGVPKTYVVTTADRAVPTALQREMAAAAGADPVDLDSDHSPFLSQPDAFVDLVARIVRDGT